MSDPTVPLTDAEVAEVIAASDALLRDMYDPNDWASAEELLRPGPKVFTPESAAFVAQAKPSVVRSLALEVQRLRAENADLRGWLRMTNADIGTSP